MKPRLQALAVGALLSSAVNAQPFPFVEDVQSVIAQVPHTSMAALWADYDGDADLDLFVSSGERGQDLDYLYVNLGAGAYQARAFYAHPGEEVNGGGWVDLDRDGDLDFVASSLGAAAALVNKSGPATTPVYVPTVLDSYYEVRDAILADYNHDGRGDVVIVRRDGLSNLLFRNAGFGFTPVSSPVGTVADNSTTACWSDVDGDGWEDLYIVNSGGQRNRLFKNTNGQLFELNAGDATDDPSYSEGCSWGDYDGDGDLDLYVTNAGPTGQANRLFRNDGGGLYFAAAGPPVQDVARSFGSAWGDVDNDGDLDLAVANRDAPDVLYLNNGAGGFTATPLGSAADGWSLAITLVDDDEDGDLDLYVANGGPSMPPARNRLFRNTTNSARHWLEVDLRGTASETFGLGARVRAYATIGGSPRVLVREVQARSGRMAQDGFRLHFGLGDATRVDSLVVEWPVSGRQVLTGVAADTLLTLAEPLPVATGPQAPPAVRPSLRVYPNPSSDLVTVVVQGVADGPVRVEVFDALGRRVGAAEGVSVAGAARLAWDGALAPAGRYVIRAVDAPEVPPSSVVIAR